MKEIFKNRNSDFFRQLFFILILFSIGGLIIFKLHYLLSSMLGGITLYVVLRKFLFFLTENKKWRSWTASLLLVGICIIVLSGIVFLVFEIINTQINSVNVDLIVSQFLDTRTKINKFLGFNLISMDLVLESKGMIAGLASNVLNTTYNFAINFIMMFIILYFLLAKAHQFEDTLSRYFPFEGTSLCLIKKEVKDIIFSNAIGIPVVMLAQALVAALGYWIVGIEHIVFWAFTTALFGLIPVVGTAAIWLPLSIYLLATGQIWQGVVLILYSIIILTNTDNACRLILMKVIADIHPLITILGVILGIPLFGFWGIIFGPLLISGFLLLIKIYYMEYRDFKYEEDSTT